MGQFPGTGREKTWLAPKSAMSAFRNMDLPSPPLSPASTITGVDSDRPDVKASRISLQRSAPLVLLSSQDLSTWRFQWPPQIHTPSAAAWIASVRVCCATAKSDSTFFHAQISLNERWQASPDLEKNLLHVSGTVLLGIADELLVGGVIVAFVADIVAHH